MNSQPYWYKTFFDGVALELWNRVATPEYTDAEIRFVRELVDIPPGGRVLDVPCGFGRHSLALAEQGFHVTGVDISEEYIHSLSRTVKKTGLPVTPIRADILEYEPSGEFDLALCMGNSFGYFPYDAMLVFVQKISCALKKGGTFLVHTGLLAESILPTVKPKDWIQVGDILFLSEHLYHAGSSVLQTNYGFVRNGQAEWKTAYYYVFTLAEIKRLLTGAGFGDIAAYSGLDKAPYRLGDPQAYLLARK